MGEDVCGGRSVQQHKVTTTLHDGVLPHRSPMYGDYVSQDSRIQSFSTWPVQLSQTPAQLASAGFFYTGCGDKVRCFSAGCGLEMWQPEDDPILEHEKWYPDCFFVRMKAAMATSETPATSEETRGETSDPAEPVCKICLTESAQVRTSSLPLLTPPFSFSDRVRPLRSPAELPQLRPQPGQLPRVSQSDQGDGQGLPGLIHSQTLEDEIIL